jgi:integrase
MPARRKPGIEIRENADGTRTYRIRWRQDGRNLSHSFDREKLAIDARNTIAAAGGICHCPAHAPEGRPAAPTAVNPSVPTFGAYAVRHAAALTGVGEGYRRDVLRDVRRHWQHLADRPIDEITRLDVAEWIRGMETGAHWWLHNAGCLRRLSQGDAPCSEGCNARRSATTIRRNLAQAGAIMESAIDGGFASRNPFRKHRLAVVETDQHAGMTFLTRAEWHVLEQALPEGTARDLCGFLVGSGLRWGEATALTVGAVDVLADPPRVYVGRAWKKDGKGGVVLGAPKSQRSRRTVPIAPWVRDLLIPHVASKADDEFLFTGLRGGPLRHHSNFYNKVWTPAVRRAQAAGLEKSPRIHDLRHSHASWLLAEGRPMTEVSRRLGHQSYAITDARYSHLMPDADAASSAALERYRTRPAD